MAMAASIAIITTTIITSTKVKPFCFVLVRITLPADCLTSFCKRLYCTSYALLSKKCTIHENIFKNQKNIMNPFFYQLRTNNFQQRPLAKWLHTVKKINKAIDKRKLFYKHQNLVALPIGGLMRCRDYSYRRQEWKRASIA